MKRQLRVARPVRNLGRSAAMYAAGFVAVQPYNPYWSRLGRTFEDPDGYRVVLQNAGWG
ncbi:MAG: hypothetical protein WBO04_04040 [Steroidobacteraceae bacterium]